MAGQTYQACEHLPREWLAGNTCPVCGKARLKIERHPHRPDQFACLDCASAFEVSQRGERVRIVEGPALLPESIFCEWLLPETVRAYAADKVARQQGLSGEPDIAALRKRAYELALLGMEPAGIRLLLEKPDEVSAEALERGRISRRERRLRTVVIALIALILFICIVRILIATSQL